MSHPVYVNPAPTLQTVGATDVAMARYSGRMGCGCRRTIHVPMSRSLYGDPGVMRDAFGMARDVAAEGQCAGEHG